MALHMIKLCVGAENVEDLAEWQDKCVASIAKKGTQATPWHDTRMSPKRAAEMLDGGSLYWVIKGQIAARQELLDVRPFTDPAGVGRCNLVVKPVVTPVVPRRQRPFQGWRYLQAHEAPADMAGGLVEVADMPEEMRKELRELGLL